MLHLPVFFKFQDTQVEPSLKQAFNAAHFSYPYFVVRLLLLFLLFSRDGFRSLHLSVILRMLKQRRMRLKKDMIPRKKHA